MTPKEKAIEIYNKFYIECMEYTEEIQCSIQAKKCALICVGEIMNEIKISRYTDWVHIRKTGEEFLNYWTEVKNEINKL